MIGTALAALLAVAPGADPGATTSPPQPDQAAGAGAAPSGQALAVPWKAGERMDFEIEYVGITMGTARIQVGATDHGVTPVTLSSRTAGMGAVITFRQTLVSNLDVVTLMPRWSVLAAEEPGNYKHTDTARFDREANKATVRERARLDKTWEVEVPPGTLDFVALIFNLRTLPLADGASHSFPVLAGRKVSTVVATVVKRELLKTGAGSFPAVKVRIPTGFDGKFSEKKPTFIWFSDDARRVVVRISTDFSIGWADADLKDYQPGGAAAP
jgi:hypothetical protein